MINAPEHDFYMRNIRMGVPLSSTSTILLATFTFLGNLNCSSYIQDSKSSIRLEISEEDL
jgi:hypothetical protein